MNITTVSNKKHMTYEIYIEHPMEMVELKLNIINNDNNPQLMNAVDRSVNYPLIRKYSNIPII